MLRSQLAIGLVEDNPGDARLIQEMLRESPIAPFRAEHLSCLNDVLERVAQEPFDVLLLDLGLPDSQGLATFDRVNQQAPMMPIIICSGAADEQLAVEAVAHGAQDYLVKGQIDGFLLKRAINYAVERKRSEQILRENENRMSFAMAAAEMGVWEVELATNQLSWSKTMAPVFGLTPDQSPKTTAEFLRLIHPEDRDEVVRWIEQAIASESSSGLEFRSVWPDGSVHWLAARAKASDMPEVRGRGLLGVAIAITERKLLEAQLRQAQKLEAVGQLAGGVAHDFNNLLTAILGFSNVVVDTLEPDDRRRSDLQEIIKAGERATTLTKQLLAFSRKQVLRPVAVNLNALVTDVRQMLGRLIGEHINLVTVLSPDLHTVRADPGQLEQIVMNLVVNARDAMPGGGRIAIETANVDLDESYAMQHKPARPGSYVMLAVSDSGIGMNEETKRRLFEPFFTTKEPGKGTGLGLATVYGIVNQSNGHIWVYSEPDAGTTFKIYLPVAHQDPDLSVSTASDEVTPTGTETLLVVEDEEAVRFLIRVILEKAGYRVFDAPDPKAAEALFEENPALFDLLVTDVIMPGLSGPKLFERLSHRRPDLKILYVSGYTGDAIVRQGHLGPGVQFLQKPFTAGDLIRRVREALDR